jgi:starch phosphorylase
MQEALETWSVDLLGRMLPRHLRIIYDLNAQVSWPSLNEKPSG